MVENMEKLVLIASSFEHYEIYEHDLHAILADEKLETHVSVLFAVPWLLIT